MDRDDDGSGVRTQETVLRYQVGDQIVFGHCKKHAWCPPTATGPDAINPHLPSLIRALIDAAYEGKIGVNLMLVSSGDDE